MDALVVGTKQILPVTRTRYGHCTAVQSEDTLKYLNKGNSLRLLRQNHNRQTILKNRCKNNALAVCSIGGTVD